MNLTRRQFLDLAAATAALPSLSGVTMAQSYPAKPVRILVGFAAGGVTDILARLTSQLLTERLGQQFRREPDGCRYQHRDRGGRTRSGGRLYAPDGNKRELDQRDPLRKPQFQFYP